LAASLAALGVRPGDRVLHMDVKFPLENYVRYLEAASSPAERSAADGYRSQFTKDVRLRIKEVTTRDYAQTLELLRLHDISHSVVGPPHGGPGAEAHNRISAASGR
jgi:hypothetical protein